MLGRYKDKHFFIKTSKTTNLDFWLKKKINNTKSVREGYIPKVFVSASITLIVSTVAVVALLLLNCLLLLLLLITILFNV